MKIKKRLEKMKIKTLLVVLSAISIFLIAGCTDKPEEPVVLKTYSIDNLDGLLTQDGIEFDREISSDGNGSVKISAAESTTVRLYETGDIDIENARLDYKARIRTEEVIGQVFLEMWCAFEGKGEYFSRGLQSLTTGESDWADSETMFFLKAGENPNNVKLNLVINGSGTVWIDDIKLVKHPLKSDEP
jgi:hypothetical protein